ncbi:MAG: hypothetical protein ACYC91_01305 [Solirubrobacteraceae bacterium]
MSHTRLVVDRERIRLFVSTDDQTLARWLCCYQRAPQGDLETAADLLRTLPGAQLEGGSVRQNVLANRVAERAFLRSCPPPSRAS